MFEQRALERVQQVEGLGHGQLTVPFQKLDQQIIVRIGVTAMLHEGLGVQASRSAQPR